MFIPDRKPAAHQVAASQDKAFTGCHVFVESGCDCRFWKNYLNSNNTKLRACNGWSEVVDAVKKNIEEGNVCLGIIDRDFRDYVNNYGDLPANVLMSDEHDVEMMIIKSEGIGRVVNNFDPADHIEKFEKKESSTVLEIILNISDKIGLLKLIDRKEYLGLKLRKKGKGTEFDLPDYENFLDKDGHYISDRKMIEYLVGWSINNKQKPRKSVDEILALYDLEKASQYDSYKLSSGHDVTHLIAHFIWKYISGEKTNKDDLEKILRATFSLDSFSHTNIYGALSQWTIDNGIIVLNNA